MGVQTPLQSTESLATAAAQVTIISLFANTPADVLVGAFAGAVVYLLSDAPINKVRLVIMFIVSFLIGIISANVIADIGSALLGLFGMTVSVGGGIGAFVSSAMTVNTIIWFNKRPERLFKKKSEEDP